MGIVRIDIYRGGPGGTDPKELVRSIDVPVESRKRLTADRARRVLARTLPEFSDKFVIRIDEGWQASRTIAPIEGCNYLFTWEYAVVYEGGEVA